MARGLSREAAASLKAIRQNIVLGLPKQIRQEFVDVTEANADLLTDTMRAVVPVSKDKDPGQLRDSIRFTMSNGGLKATIMAGGLDAPHATWVEFGTEDTAPNSFFWSSYRLLRTVIKRNFAKGLTKVIKAYNAMKGG